jgi:hypothetical protein
LGKIEARIKNKPKGASKKQPRSQPSFGKILP